MFGLRSLGVTVKAGLCFEGILGCGLPSVIRHLIILLLLLITVSITITINVTIITITIC